MKLFVNLWEEKSKCKYHLGILKCEVSLEGLFMSGVSLKDCKGSLEPTIQDGGLEP